MFKQIVLLLTFVPLHLNASNAGASSAAAATGSTPVAEADKKSSHTTSSTAEHDVKDRKSETPSPEADNKQLAAIGEKVKETLTAVGGYYGDFTGLMRLQHTNPDWFTTRCCHVPELGWETPLHYAVRQHSHQSHHDHLIACLFSDATQLSAPGADGLPPILMCRDRLVIDRDRGDQFKTAQIVLFDVDNPNVQDQHGKTILHSVVSDQFAEEVFNPRATFGDITRRTSYYLYQAARYFVAHGLNPDLRNAAGQTAVETIANPRVRTQFEAEIKRGKEDHKQKNGAVSLAIQQALTFGTDNDQVFKTLAPLIGSYVGVPKNQNLAALIQQFKNEARRFTGKTRDEDHATSCTCSAGKRIMEAISS